MLSAMLYDTLIKYLSLFFIKMDKEDTRLFLESSPQYPNLLSVMQTLEYIKFDAKVGKCSWDYLKNLESPFLLHISINTQEIPQFRSTFSCEMILCVEASFYLYM